jgi:hypothetical protein
LVWELIQEQDFGDPCPPPGRRKEGFWRSVPSPGEEKRRILEIHALPRGGEKKDFSYYRYHPPGANPLNSDI